jgi:hypothetical protein
LKFSRVNTETAQCSAGTQAAQTIFKRHLKSERFDGDVGAPFGKFLNIGNNIALGRIEQQRVRS